MGSYEYFDHPYWDTRKSRRPGKKYINPYMPDPSAVAKHGSEFSGQSMTRPHQHLQEMSTPGAGGTASHPSSIASDNTRLEGASSNFDVHKMTRREKQEQLRVAQEAQEVPGLSTPQPFNPHYGHLQGYASDFVHQYPAHLHPQQPLQHHSETFHHYMYSPNTFQQQQQQSVVHNPGIFMTPFGHHMSQPQQHPVATAEGYQPSFYHSSPVPDQTTAYQDSPVLYPSQFNTNFSANHSVFSTPEPPNFNHNPLPNHPVTSNLPLTRHTSPQRSPQQRFARASPSPATTVGQVAPTTNRQLALHRFHFLEDHKKTILARRRELNDEQHELETRIAEMKTRNTEKGMLDADDQALMVSMETLRRVEGYIEEVTNMWDRVEMEVEEAFAEIAVGDWN